MPADSPSVCPSSNGIDVVSSAVHVYSDIGSGAFADALNNIEVKATIAKFDSIGYAVDLPNSFIIEGTGVPDGALDSVDVRVTHIVMRYVSDTTRGLIDISHMKCLDRADVREAVRTLQFAFVPPLDAGYEMVRLGVDAQGYERFVWIKSFIPSFGAPMDYPAYAKLLVDMDGYKKCVIIGVIVACGIGALVCILAGPGWLVCFVYACGMGATAAAAIACAIAQML